MLFLARMLGQNVASTQRAYTDSLINTDAAVFSLCTLTLAFQIVKIGPHIT